MQGQRTTDSWGQRAVIPQHVRHCGPGAGARDWYVYTWRRSDPARKLRRPYACGSWRCPACARHEAAVTFARIRQAVERQGDPSGWVFAVLTLDRDGYYTGARPWADERAAYRDLSRLSTRWLRRMARAGYPIASQWVAVVESHRSGWPHVNVFFFQPALAAELRLERERREGSGLRGRELVRVEGPLASVVTAAGFGRESTIEAARSTDALGGYIVKLAGRHDAAVGEVAKLCQAPLNAPVRFRRLRAGRRFLPPRHKNLEVTGTLLRRRRSDDGTVDVLLVHRPSALAAADVEECARWEERIADAEDNINAAVRQGRVAAWLAPRCPAVVALSGAHGARAPPWALTA